MKSNIKCINNKTAVKYCFSQICDYYPFLCQQECDCTRNHTHQKGIISAKKISEFNTLKINNTNFMNGVLTEISHLEKYSVIMNSVWKRYRQNLERWIINRYECVKFFTQSNDYSQIKGKILKELYNTFRDENQMKKQLQKIKIHFEKQINQLKKLEKTTSEKIQVLERQRQKLQVSQIYTFSQINKAQNLEIKNNIICQTINSSNNGYSCLGTIEPSFSYDQYAQIKLKVVELGQDIIVGICEKQQIERKKYKFLVGRDCDHGIYGISTKKFIYRSNQDTMKHELNIQAENILNLQYRYLQKKLIITNLSTNKKVSVNVNKIKQKAKLCFCFGLVGIEDNFFFKKKDSLQIINYK